MENRFEIRQIAPEDNPSVERLVKETLVEFGAIGDGFASSDPELSDMYAAYQDERSNYFVLMDQNEVVGGAGVAPLKNENSSWCELQKMYFKPKARGKGQGKILLSKCIDFAKKVGYKHIYIETLHNMKDAQKLYASFGFDYIQNRKGGTGHTSCPVFMHLTL